MYAIDTLCLFFTLWAVGLLLAMKPVGEAVNAGLRSVIDGFRYLATNPVLMASFLIDLVAMIFGTVRAEFPQIAHESFGGPLEGGSRASGCSPPSPSAPCWAGCSPGGSHASSTTAERCSAPCWLGGSPSSASASP